jgi:putative chitinase
MTDASFGAALSRLWPRAPRATVEAVAAIAEPAFARYGVETPLEIAHCMAQVSHECGAGRIVRENMNYRAERIVEIFGYDKDRKRWVHSARVTDAEAEQLAHHPEALAERVYGLGNPKKARELGNTEPGDGYRFRGNGMLQLTGRAAHRRIGKLIGVDLENDPEQLEDPAISFRVAVAEFVALRCLEPAAADDIVVVTKRVNGGRNGLADRIVWLRKWKTALEGVEEPAMRPRGAEDSQAKTIAQSKIAKGSTIGIVLSTIEAGRQVANTASEVSSAARETADSAGAVVSVANPLLASASLPWALLAIAVVGALAFVLWDRYRKLQNEGV